jgi:hypothetical protein
VVELAYRLSHQGEGDVGRGVFVLRLHYDVWDDVYSLERGDTTRTFDSFATLRRAVEQLRRVPIVAVDRLQPAGVYRITLSVAVHPLRGGAEREIVGWVDDTVRNSEGAWHEQLLNVNGLIHRFFARDRSDDNRSEWFESILFTPASLPLENRTAGGQR